MNHLSTTTVQAEQSQTSWHFTWWQKKSRQLVMNFLSSISGAGLTLWEDNQSHFFGDKNAQLQAEIEILDKRFYTQIIKGGSIALAEEFIQQTWTTDDLTALIQVFARNQKESDSIENLRSFLSRTKHKLTHVLNKNSIKQSKKNILAHYDLGNQLYTRFLDGEMVYSSAIYANQTQSLEQAQLNKFEVICQSLGLKPTDHLLEIGTGWGGLAVYAAKNYGCKVTTTTISDQQHQYAKEKIEAHGLTSQITLLKRDYRLLEGTYDKLVSVEMIEAVGKEYFKTFFKKCDSLLKPQGKMLLQAITIADQRFQSYSNNVDFIQRYIFPGGCLPSVTVMNQHLTSHTDMVSEALIDIGLDYAKTLKEWRKRFNQKWSELESLGYDDSFKRLWLYYLCYCEAAFLERRVSTVQLLARKLV